MFAKEIFSVKLFAICVLAVYVSFLLFIIHRLYYRISGKKIASKLYDNKYFSAFVCVAGVLGMLCMLWGFFVEPHILTVTKVVIETDKIPPDVAPVRIVQVSDLHFSAANRMTSKLPSAISALEPDVIVLTGDYINSTDALPVLESFLNQLHAPFGIYYVYGNYDTLYYPGKAFANSSCINLEYKTENLLIRGAKIQIIGAPFNFNAKQIKKITAENKEYYKILLSHFPEDFPLVFDTQVDLHLAGHVHGGQVRLPFYGALITLSATGKRYEMGLYEERGKKLFVSRGIGMEGGERTPKVRFNCPPEIVLIEISAKK